MVCHRRYSRRQLFANAAIAASRVVRIAVRRCAVLMLPKGQRPQPWLAYQRGRGPALCLEHSRRAPAPWRRGEVQLDRLAAGTRARLGGEFSGAGLKDQRRDLLGAVDADPGAEQPAARDNSTCEMSIRDSRSSRLHAGQRRGGRGLHDGACGKFDLTGRTLSVF